eukprot:jgi/Psemu1/1086/gm1.1086_g
MSDQSKEQHVSKVHLMRKEMTSFREELNAVKKSLSNEFQSKRSLCEDEDDDWKKTNAFAPKESAEDLFPEIKKVDSKGTSDQEVWKKIDMLAMKEQTHRTVDGSQFDSNACSDQDDVWNEANTLNSKEQTLAEENSPSEKTYFKSEWNFNFPDNEKQLDKQSDKLPNKLPDKQPDKQTDPNDLEVEKSTENEKKAPEDEKRLPENEEQQSDTEEQMPKQSDESSSLVTEAVEESAAEPRSANATMETSESSVTSSKEELSEAGDTPFDESTETKKEEKNSNEEKCNKEKNDKDEDKREKTVPSSSPKIDESQRSELERLIMIHDYLQREKAKNRHRIDTDGTEYDEDLEIVRSLMKKYGHKTTSKSPRVSRPKPGHAAIAAPSDAWFHRHAVGSASMRRKFEKPSSAITDEKKRTDLPLRDSTERRNSSLRENRSLSNGIKSVSWKKVNRVHFVTNYDRPVHASTPKGNKKPVGKLADKIKFWEGNTA